VTAPPVRERAIAWTRAGLARLCDRTVPWAHGTALFATEVPDYWDCNLVRVEGAPGALDAAALAAEADRIQAHLEHRRVSVEDEATGAALRGGFEALGWATERLAVLWRPAGAELLGASAGPREAMIEPAPATDVEPLRRAWLREEPWGTDEVIESNATLDAYAMRRLPSTTLVARVDPSGPPVAYVRVRIDGDGAEIDDAYCLASHRGRGLGSALLTAAIVHAEAAGVRDLFITADDEGDARRLYERLGFRTVWRRHDFIRRPVEA
jgi:ribosomal protein S18 acetylase RimI-like enzyme